MDSPAPLELVRPWRTATLVAAAIAAVELVLLVVAGMVLVGRSLAPHSQSVSVHRPAPAAKPAPAPVAKPVHVVARLPRSRTGVLILNGNGVQGAAAQAASLVTARGYVVKQVGNAPHSGYPTWRLMYGPGYAGEANRFARDLDMPASHVGPLDGLRPAQLHGGQLVLILGATR